MRFTETQLEILRKNNQESNRLTKQAIQDSLFLLMKDQEFSKITITEIINKSGVSRSAFYRNFKSKEEILNEQILEVVTKTLIMLTQSHFNNWVTIFQVARDNQFKLEMLISAKMEYLLYSKLMDFPILEETMDRFTYHIWIGIIYSVLMDWTKRGMVETNEEITFKTLLALNEMEKRIQNKN